MNQLSLKQESQASVIESVLIGGDLSKLSPEQRVIYYNNVCDSVGLNKLTKPFDYITLNGKMVLYAKKDATDQLRKIHQVSVTELTKEIVDGVLVVIAKGKDKTGREDVATGAVTVQGLKGDHLANAFMKGETKAKRRLTLSLCGLGLLDETELETISELKPGVRPDAYGQPTENDGIVDDGVYRVSFGKFAKRKLEEIDPKELASYLDYLEAEAKKKGKPITGQVLDFMQRADKYLVALDLATDPTAPRFDQES